MEITTNQLSLTGVIMENPQFDHEVFGEAFFRTVLSVPRLSGAFDLLPLTISERLMGEDFQQGATVAIGGQLRSYNKVMGGAGRLLLTAFAQHLRPVDEEENPNTVFLSGALCKPPSFRTTPFGRATLFLSFLPKVIQPDKEKRSFGALLPAVYQTYLH